MGTTGSAPPPPLVRDRYRETLEGLFRRRRFGLRPGLDVIRALLAGLDHPERRYPSLHVTGSKGKGSVGAMAQAILSEHGLRTGLFTSPHLASFRERIRLDRRLIDPESIVDGVARIDATADRLERAGTIDHPPTFFETTTALGLDWFAREGADAAVVEVGIGGRLDATNVLDARVGVVTTIELEHTDLLGPTLGAIAREKSGILHPGMTGVIGELPEEALAVVTAEATRVGVPLWRFGTEIRVEDRALAPDGQTFTVRIPGARFDGLHLRLLGRFQPANAALAIAATARFLAHLGRALDPEAVGRGLERVEWPGRLERVAERPELYYDVAHTPESARAVAQSLAEISPLADPSESAIVFGSLAGKEVERILDALAPLARTLVVVPIRSERGLPPDDIRIRAAGRFPRVVVATSAPEGLRLARAATGPDGLTLAIGSDYLIGELVRDPNRASEEPDLSDPGVTGPVPKGRVP